MTFQLDISKFVEKAKGNADEVVRKVTLDVFGRVIKRTPVDTGRLKGNWQFGDSTIPSGTVDTLDKSGNSTTTKVAAGIPKKAAGRIYYLVNNLPYAMEIERGSSKVQAPQGMVGITVVEFEELARRAAGGMA